MIEGRIPAITIPVSEDSLALTEIGIRIIPSTPSTCLMG
jgi:hypothetical protein